MREPQPLPAARDLYPEAFAHFSTAPCFLFFALEAPSSPAAERGWPQRD